jgi:hypothetical protein
MMTRPSKTYIATVAFTVHPTTHEHFQSEQGIRDELASWCESLGAKVEAVDIREVETDGTHRA